MQDCNPCYAGSSPVAVSMTDYVIIVSVYDIYEDRVKPIPMRVESWQFIPKWDAVQTAERRVRAMNRGHVVHSKAL